MNIFSVYSEHPDVELLMQQVQEKLQRWERGEGLEPLQLTALPFGHNDADWEQPVRLLSSQWDIDGGAIIHSTRPVLSRPIIVFQQIVRRLTWWYLEPILQQIRDFHLHTAQSVTGLFRRQQAQANELAEMTERLTRLEHIVHDLSQRLTELEGASPSNEEER